MKRFESVVVVGSSGSGKTTLVNGLRTEEYQASLAIPRRFITRPGRLGDDLIENTYVDKRTFEEGVYAGCIRPYWSRTLEAGRQERYGFEAVGRDDERLRVYSANNAFLRDKNSSVVETLGGALVIVAMAAAESRDERLGQRSPDMSEAERSVRLSDAGIDVLAASGVDIEVIDTTGLSPSAGQHAIQSIIDGLIG